MEELKSRAPSCPKAHGAVQAEKSKNIERIFRIGFSLKSLWSIPTMLPKSFALVVCIATITDKLQPANDIFRQISFCGYPQKGSQPNYGVLGFIQALR